MGKRSERERESGVLEMGNKGIKIEQSVVKDVEKSFKNKSG